MRRRARFMSYRRNILKIYVGIIALGGIYIIFIKASGFAIPCMFHKITGLLCPGCGTTHLFLAMASLHIREAFFYNPAVFILLCLWILVSGLCMFRKTAVIMNARVLYTLLYLSIAFLSLFGVIRNFS